MRTSYAVQVRVRANPCPYKYQLKARVSIVNRYGHVLYDSFGKKLPVAHTFFLAARLIVRDAMG